MSELVFIDADGHLLEPPSALVDHAPDEHSDSVWQVRADDDGVEWLTLEDMRMEAAVMALAAAGGFDEATRVRAHSGDPRYSELPDYCWGAEGRLAALDADDISQSVLYPAMLPAFQHLRSIEFAAMPTQMLAAAIAELDLPDRRAIAGGNAAALYGLDLT